MEENDSSSVETTRRGALKKGSLVAAGIAGVVSGVPSVTAAAQETHLTITGGNHGVKSHYYVEVNEEGIRKGSNANSKDDVIQCGTYSIAEGWVINGGTDDYYFPDSAEITYVRMWCNEDGRGNISAQLEHNDHNATNRGTDVYGTNSDHPSHDMRYSWSNVTSTSHDGCNEPLDTDDGNHVTGGIEHQGHDCYDTVGQFENFGSDRLYNGTVEIIR